MCKNSEGYAGAFDGELGSTAMFTSLEDMFDLANARCR